MLLLGGRLGSESDLDNLRSRKRLQRYVKEVVGKLDYFFYFLGPILAADVDELSQELMMEAPSTGEKIRINHVVNYLWIQFDS